MNDLISPLLRRLELLHDELCPLDGGEVATYIPELGQADPTSWGLAIVTANADAFAVGDTQTEFSIQSVSKPFVYAMALMDRGPEAVLDRVGIEPTGDPFNAVTLSETTGRPLNPMVNAGAILTSSLVAGNSAAARTARILAGLSAFAGRPLSIDRDVMASEYGASNRNRAISYLMRGSGALELDVEEALEVYIAQCSVRVTALDLATMSATLASGGRNPVTGEQVVPDRLVAAVLSIMATCGMYDGAGAWLYRVGLPAKSGVSGGIVAALPNQLGLAAWSPPLDQHGNSVRGVRAMEELSADLGLHVFSPTGGATNAIRRQASAAVLRSRAGRSLTQQQQLAEFGERIQIVELGGAIGILAAQQITDRLLDIALADELGWLILDARNIGYLHPGALKIISEALLTMMDREITVRVVDSAAHCSGASDSRWPCLAEPRLDAILQGCEDDLMSSLHEATGDATAEIALADCEVLRDLVPDDLATVRLAMRRVKIPTGAEVSDDGEPIRGLLWVLEGELNVSASVSGRLTRVQGVGAGCVFGEMSLVDSGNLARQAVAVDAATIMILDVTAIGRLTREDPDVITSMLRSVARILVARQHRAQEIIANLAAGPDSGVALDQP